MRPMQSKVLRLNAKPKSRATTRQVKNNAMQVATMRKRAMREVQRRRGGHCKNGAIAIAHSLAKNKKRSNSVSTRAPRRR